jgi:hypothetical protein
VWTGSRKGSAVWGRGREMSGRGRVHGGERGRLEGGDGSDRRGPQDRERACKRTSFSADERGLRDRESKRACAERTGADRSTPPGSEREREERAGAG